MGIYGGMEVQYYQLTPVGVQRAQSGQAGHLGAAERQVLRELAELGGTAEWDELKTHGSFDSPSVLGTALRRLVDMGLVAPVTVQQQ